MDATCARNPRLFVFDGVNDQKPSKCYSRKISSERPLGPAPVLWLRSPVCTSTGGEEEEEDDEVRV